MASIFGNFLFLSLCCSKPRLLLLPSPSAFLLLFARKFLLESTLLYDGRRRRGRREKEKEFTATMALRGREQREKNRSYEICLISCAVFSSFSFCGDFCLQCIQTWSWGMGWGLQSNASSPEKTGRGMKGRIFSVLSGSPSVNHSVVASRKPPI